MDRYFLPNCHFCKLDTGSPKGRKDLLRSQNFLVEPPPILPKSSPLILYILYVKSESSTIRAANPPYLLEYLL